MKNSSLLPCIISTAIMFFACKPVSYRKENTAHHTSTITNSTTISVDTTDITQNNNDGENTNSAHTKTSTDNQAIANEKYQACLDIAIAFCHTNQRCLQTQWDCKESAHNICESLQYKDPIAVTIDTRALKTCISDLTTIDCKEWLSKNLPSLPAISFSECENIFQGKLLENEYCHIQHDCDFTPNVQNFRLCGLINECKHGFCASDPLQISCSRCRAFSSEGDTCNDTLPCWYDTHTSKPLICSPLGKCLYWQAEENQKCEKYIYNCGENLFCDDTLEIAVCKRLPVSQQPCHNGICASKAFCNDDNICEEKIILHESDLCGEKSSSCSSELYCDTITQQCSSKKTENDSCSNNIECEDGFICQSDNINMTCSRTASIGDPCFINDSCLAGFGWCQFNDTYDEYVCSDQPLPKKDEPCGKNNECAYGYYCIETLSFSNEFSKTCVPKKNIHEACDDDKECKSSQCKNNKCNDQSLCGH